MLIDSHCHLQDREFFTEQKAEEMLERARKRGVTKIVCIGTDPKDSLVARDYASAHEGVYWTYGVHPENAVRVAETDFFESISRFDFLTRRSLTRPRGSSQKDGSLDAPAYDVLKKSSPTNKKVSSATRPVAIGEVGLDYHYEDYDRKAQIRLFEEMLQLAIDNDLPVSFHIREAFDDFFPVVANFPKVRGVVHSFTDSKKVLRRIVNETEFYIGVNGLATYSTLPMPPLERIMLETDAPFLAPVPHRGGTNEPGFVADVADWLASRLEMPLAEVAEITTRNTERLFDFS